MRAGVGRSEADQLALRQSPDRQHGGNLPFNPAQPEQRLGTRRHGGTDQQTIPIEAVIDRLQPSLWVGEQRQGLRRQPVEAAMPNEISCAAHRRGSR
jgi:hypothetical protein